MTIRVYHLFNLSNELNALYNNCTLSKDSPFTFSLLHCIDGKGGGGGEGAREWEPGSNGGGKSIRGRRREGGKRDTQQDGNQEK